MRIAAEDVRSSRRWWLIAAVLIAAFLARAPLYLSVFPPFEGWDEYQHLAYIVHLDRARAIPVLGDAPVSLALRPLVVSLPHSPNGRDQVKEWGAVAYDEYWKTGPPPDRGVSSSFRLYQAQHPPLAYALALPLWRDLRTPRPLEAIYAIRAMNVVLVAAALAVFAAALSRLMPAFGPRVAVLALVCLHPLFFQNAARVANDALALAAGLAGISLLVLADGRTLLTRGLLAAVCVAASVWSKQTGLTLIPALVMGMPLVGWVHGVPIGRLLRVTAVVGSALLVLVSPLWVWSYEHYGTIVTTQESLELGQKGAVVPALVTAFQHLRWSALIDTVFVPGRPWVGGWSFVPIHETLAAGYGWYWSVLVAVAVVGALITAVRRSSSGQRRAGAGLLVSAVVVTVTALGMIHHAVVSHAVFGHSTTNPWYFMTALPFLFVLVVRGLEGVHRHLATAGPAVLAALFVAIELHGTWVQMPRAYTGSVDAALQWSRLSSIHPAILSGDYRWWFLGAHLGALCLVLTALLFVSRKRA